MVKVLIEYPQVNNLQGHDISPRDISTYTDIYLNIKIKKRNIKGEVFDQVQISKYGYIEIHYTVKCAQKKYFEIDIERPTQISGCKYYSKMKIFDKN